MAAFRPKRTLGGDDGSDNQEQHCTSSTCQRNRHRIRRGHQRGHRCGGSSRRAAEDEEGAGTPVSSPPCDIGHHDRWDADSNHRVHRQPAAEAKNAACQQHRAEHAQSCDKANLIAGHLATAPKIRCFDCIQSSGASLEARGAAVQRPATRLWITSAG